MEKYSLLFELRNNLYNPDIPVMICAGVLRKENETGHILAQLRMQNVSQKFKAIKAVKVNLDCCDTAGAKLFTKTMQYLDLNVERGQEFGGRTPIYLENNTVRSFSISSVEVVYSDGELWISEKFDWISLGRQKKIEEALGDKMAEQYRLDTFQDARFEVFSNNGVWKCACGALNNLGEKCCCCNNTLSELTLALDHNILAKNIREREEKKANERSKKKQKVKKASILLVSVFVALSVLVWGLSLIGDGKRKELLTDSLVGTRWTYTDISYRGTDFGKTMEFIDNGKATHLFHVIRDNFGEGPSPVDWEIKSISNNKAIIWMGSESVGSLRMNVFFTINSDGEYEITSIEDWDGNEFGRVLLARPG